MAKKQQKEKVNYMPIPDAPDTSAVDAVMGYSFPKEERYPVTSAYQKAGHYAPYTNRAMQLEEQKKIQDELLNEEVKFMSRNPGSAGGVDIVDRVMADSYNDAPQYEDSSSYEQNPSYGKPMNFRQGMGYGETPFNRLKKVDNGYVSPNNPYKIDPGISSPFGMTPMERMQIEDAVKKAMGGMGGQIKDNSSFEENYRRSKLRR